ncbi:23S rRNA (guanosine(2251)-2'-O)-methyltransferase RlmB [candidate division KSB1 bacterium]|nr:23S rRNA (guanosine(2251)-2'-O)-methyltransferase RlmB [candidate division KSB1 bacterium]
MPKIIFGINPVLEALKSDNPPEKVYLLFQMSGPGIREVIQLAERNKVTWEQVDRARWQQIGADKHAQGVAALIAEYDYRSVADILQMAQQQNEPAFVTLLDNLEDPRNFGAIIRSADAAGVHGIIIPKHRAVGITEIVASSSAGALAHSTIARETNLITAIDELKRAGVWIYGSDHTATQTIYQTDLTSPLAIVIGSEGKGMRRLVRENCDFLMRIPMKGKINSLNASVAAAVIFFEVLRQREVKKAARCQK